MKKLLVLIFIIPFVSFGQLSNNFWEKLNKNNVTSELEKQGYKVTTENKEGDYGNLTLFYGTSTNVFGNFFSAIHQKKSITISFLNGSAWSYNLEDEVSMKSQLQDPTVKNSGIAYMYKPVYEKSKTFHRKIFSDFRNKYYSKRNVDKIIIDTKNRYETETFQIDGYTIKVKASIDISNLGISQASKVDIYAPKKEYLLGENINIDKVNNYDIPTMINAFITDLKYYFSQDNKETTIFNKVINGDIISKFKSLEGNTIALAKGYKDDNRVEVLIDPVKWKNSSSPKRWYILYHELGHDILNLEHGNGGKMMFNFADRDYVFPEFFTDKKYMFKHYGLVNGLKPNIAVSEDKELAPKVISEDPYGAIEEYTKAIKLNPNDPSAYRDRGLEKNSIGDVKGACLDWKQAIKLGDNISAKWVRAQCN